MSSARAISRASATAASTSRGVDVRRLDDLGDRICVETDDYVLAVDPLPTEREQQLLKRMQRLPPYIHRDLHRPTLTGRSAFNGSAAASNQNRQRSFLPVAGLAVYRRARWRRLQERPLDALRVCSGVIGVHEPWRAHGRASTRAW